MARLKISSPNEYGLAFNGANQDVVAPYNAAVDLTNNFTYSFWMKVVSGAINADMCMTSRGIGSMFITLLNGKIVFGWRGYAYLGYSKATIARNKWYFISVTKAGTTYKIFIDGKIDNVVTDTNTLSTVNSVLNIAQAVGNVAYYKGSIKDLRIYNTVLTENNVRTMYEQGVNVSFGSPVAWYKLNEGSGSTAIDSSSTANNGTLTNAPTWQLDVVRPTRNGVNSRTISAAKTAINISRKIVDFNLVKNGDFSSVPTFVAPTTASGGYWIDGTASGSLTNDSYSWIVGGKVTSASVQFDTSTQYNGKNSLKLSTLDAAGRIRVNNGPMDAFTTAGKNIRTYGIPVIPNSTYTLSFAIKTNNVATNSAYIDILGYKGDGTTTGSLVVSPKTSGTNDWQIKTVDFTAPADAFFIGIRILNDVAGNISDAWFANIQFNLK